MKKKSRSDQGKQTVTQTTGLTTADEELEFRQRRGRQEQMHVEVLEKAPHPFVSYAVHSQTGTQYTVELRSLTDPINSCCCPDFHVNTLKTCKHIEGVLHHLQQNPKRGGATGSPFVEIFLEATENPRVSIAWPKKNLLSADHKQAIQAYFSVNNTLLSPPLLGLASLEHTLTQVSRDVREQVRISAHLQSWLTTLTQKQAHALSRDQFMEDVRLGKRSMHMLSVPLYPYQEEGMLHLAFQGRAILADDMGLGKTIQAIGACELLRRLHDIQKVVVICPASLKGEWDEQIAKFTGLPTVVVRGPRAERLQAYTKDAFFYLTNYEQIRSDFADIQSILKPDIVILDEAQRIKNWQTKTAWAVKQLKSPYAFVLSGTPIENRIDEIYSIMQVVDPSILGPLFKFNRDFYQFNEKNKAVGYQNLAELHRKLKPVLLRRLKKDVETQLPERTINNFFVGMEPEQLARYTEYSDKVAKLIHLMKKRPLTAEEAKRLQQWLACMRMLADTPYILDENCRICPKLDELKQILVELLQDEKNKIIIFSEWERMLMLVRDMLKEEFSVDFAWHTGSVPQIKRLEDIKRFKNDPLCRVFLTTDSGSTGLNLQVANVVINMDLPWNPAKLEQRIARAWRKNQVRSVQVINFVCEDSIEHRMLTTLAQKQTLADGVLDGLGNLDRMKLPSARMEILEQLQHLATTEISELMAAPVSQADPMDGLKSDAIAHFNDRIHTLEVHQSASTNSKTIVAVVDKIDVQIKTKMREFVKAADATNELELLDQETFALLQRLAAAGVISIHGDAGTPLYRSSVANRSLESERTRQLAEAKKLLAETERKAKMMNVLATGGFPIESLAAAKEALCLGLKCHAVLKNGTDSHGEALTDEVDACILVADEQQAEALVTKVNRCLLSYAEAVTKLALR